MNMADLYALMKETLSIMGLGFHQMDQVTIELSASDNTVIFTHATASVSTVRRVKLEALT